MNRTQENDTQNQSAMLSYVPAHLAIEAMRDNGYKNPAYAIAELIDNSIQADATKVELLCAEKEIIHSTRKTLNLEEIAILDNGKGMNKEVLSMALQFGNGTRLSRNQRTGMGRFGMGLPASSISQCRRVDVWSWTDGVENAICIHLDIDDIKSGKSVGMPEPEERKIPAIWLENGEHFEKTGTLVVWSKLDRVIWRKGKTIIDNSEKVIGRMYRKFLDTEKISIRMLAFDMESVKGHSILTEKQALPNDPMYLMEKTSSPEPFKNIPMFRHFPNIDSYEIPFIVTYREEEHSLTVRLAYAKDEARQMNNAGSQPHGKHAQSNEGISIVRAGRELEVDKTLLISHETTERWWGIEVEFPPTLDEIMGVSNNKQSARNFSSVLQTAKDMEDLLNKNGKTYAAYLDELEEEGDPSAPLLVVGMEINKQLKILREVIKKQTKGIRTPPSTRHGDDLLSPEKKASDITKKRSADGNSGFSDQGENKSNEEKEKEIEETLKQTGFSETEASGMATAIAKSEIKYHFESSSFEGSAFFSVKPAGGKIIVNLNTKHPAYNNLLEVLDNDSYDNEDIEVLQEKLFRTKNGLKLLLMAWARYEDELPDSRREDATDVRQDWGRISRRFLSEDE
ncbi:ATP-binding protein [Planococcus kocurii]|uniref:ATP-binding protein n=1 Tax=Planococcus kocurii TaxID=1374 RepID=UPI003D032C82